MFDIMTQFVKLLPVGPQRLLQWFYRTPTVKTEKALMDLAEWDPTPPELPEGTSEEDEILAKIEPHVILLNSAFLLISKKEPDFLTFIKRSSLIIENVGYAGYSPETDDPLNVIAVEAIVEIFAIIQSYREEEK